MAGQEREFARNLEARYREALGLISDKKNSTDCRETK
jgi:hypothetical protein